METIAEIKQTIWKAKKMFWYDRESNDTERIKFGYGPMVRVILVNGLRNDNTMWFSQIEITGKSGEVDPKTKLDHAFSTLNLSSEYGEPQAPVTDDEFAQIVEKNRVENNGTYFEEDTVPEIPSI